MFHVYTTIIVTIWKRTVCDQFDTLHVALNKTCEAVIDNVTTFANKVVVRL